MSDPVHAEKQPRLALFLATGFGLGYLPIAPGSWGSLGGVALAWGLAKLPIARRGVNLAWEGRDFPFYFSFLVAVILATAILGVWAAGRAARHFGKEDPGPVVIDEISGQLATFIGLGLLLRPNWKYLLAGFILFRAFDIWKPFPARQAESLPGGWGIMADDWVAGIYAALGLWLLRALGV